MKNWPVREISFTTKQMVLADVGFQVGRTLERERTKRGITQTELARMIDSSQVVISRVESGSSVPSFKWLNKVARKLGCYLKPPVFVPFNPLISKRK